MDISRQDGDPKSVRGKKVIFCGLDRYIWPIAVRLGYFYAERGRRQKLSADFKGYLDEGGNFKFMFF